MWPVHFLCCIVLPLGESTTIHFFSSAFVLWSSFQLGANMNCAGAYILLCICGGEYVHISLDYIPGGELQGPGKVRVRF